MHLPARSRGAFLVGWRGRLQCSRQQAAVSARHCVHSPHLQIHPAVPNDITRVMRKRYVPHPLDSAAAESGFKEPWSVVAAALIERLPVVTPAQTMDETIYAVMQSALHQSRAKTYPEEWTRTDQYEDEEQELTDPSQQAKPKEGSLAAFEPAPRLTADDASGNVKTTNRRLDDRLFLVVKSAADGQWTLPSVLFEGEAGVRDAAQQEVHDHVGSGLDLFWTGHSPIMCHKLQYDTSKQTGLGRFGAKMFIYKAQYIAGSQPNLDKSRYSEYAWLARDELPGYLSPALADDLLPVLPAWHNAGHDAMD